MLISDQKKLIYIHIPKTGGESLTGLLKKSGFRNTLTKHEPIITLKALMGERFSHYQTVSVVRNPWEQVVSLYEQFRKPLYMREEEIKRQYPKFDGFLGPYIAAEMAMESDFNEWVLRIYGYKELIHPYFMDQTFYLQDEYGNVIVDNILRFERLLDDVKAFQSKFDIDGEIEHINKSRAKISMPIILKRL